MPDISRQLFYSGLRRFLLILTLATGIPLVLLWAAVRWSLLSTAEFLPVMGLTWIVLLVLGGCVYMLLHYRAIHATIDPMIRVMTIGELAVRVAHDIRGPLTGIQAALATLQAVSGADARCGRAVELLTLSTERLHRTADELLQAHGGEAAVVEPFAVQPLLERILKEYAAQPTLAGVTFQTAWGDQPLWLAGKRNRIERLFANVIKNAIEAMDMEGTLTVTTSRRDEQMSIAIRDTGCGMPPALIEQLQTGPVTSGKAGGHGIGFTVVREVVAEHGGTIAITSMPGQGTCFGFTFPVHATAPIVATGEQPLPVARSSAAAAPWRPEAARAAVPGATPEAMIGRGYTILVIDDDEDIRFSWELMCEELHIETLHAFACYEDFVASPVETTTIDMAFVDKNVPNSKYTAREMLIDLHRRGVPRVILASGENAQALRQDADFAEADFVIQQKIPTSFQEFVS